MELPLVTQMITNKPAVQETRFKVGMASHSGILSWRIPWTEEPGRLQSIGSQRVGHS